jgi:hypothetical protein
MRMFMTKTPEKSDSASHQDAPINDRNLSGDIERTMEKEPYEQVRCVRVFGDFYRCNWWAPVGRRVTSVARDATYSVFETYRVRKSSFLMVSLREGRLIVKDLSKPQ